MERDILRRLIKRLRGASRADIEILTDATTRLRRDLDALKALSADKRELEEQNVELRLELMQQRRVLGTQGGGPVRRAGRAPPPRADAPSLEACMAELREAAPAAFDLWQRLSERAAAEYDALGQTSCSVTGHVLAEAFGGFVAPYLRGTVLDVGCGPQPLPVYLSDHPVELIAGIDPLLPVATHPFTFARGVAEMLPWDDASFDIVIAATSLDHVLLLDRSLDEARRVLRPDGRFLVWIAVVDGAAAYDPRAARVSAVDDFHLFHFGTDWAETMFESRFVIEEKFCFRPPHNASFYSLVPRPR
jgi:SAM-dependent methyltransferase